MSTPSPNVEEGSLVAIPSQFDFPPSSQEDDYYSFHCHWNHCDFSFTSLFEFDNHLLYNHIPTQMEALQEQQPAIPLPIDDGFQCQWDECQTKAYTETELVEHVKQDHLPDTSKEHHQCLWVEKNGIFPLIQN
jgi:hypothetical protein